MTDYQTIEGGQPEPLVKHEPRTLAAVQDGTTTHMMSEIADSVFVAWDLCARCGKHVSQCTEAAGPSEPEYIRRWRDERFEKSLNARPKLDVVQTLELAKQLRDLGWTVEKPPTTVDPAIGRAIDSRGRRPVENVALPEVDELHHTGKHELEAEAEEAAHGVPSTEDVCKFPTCDESLDDGEGWDNYCGTHADKVYGHEENPDDHECDEECPLYEGDEDVLVRTPEDFAEIKAMGWSGCMHDSDCACTGAARVNDDKILDAWAQQKRVVETVARQNAEAIAAVAAVQEAARANGFDPGF